jgi:hypothetical protein
MSSTALYVNYHHILDSSHADPVSSDTEQPIHEILEPGRGLLDGAVAPETIQPKRAKSPAYAVHTLKELKRYARFGRLYGELKYQRPVVRMR